MSEWLRQLKVGDEVVLNDPYSSAPLNHRIERVSYVNRFVVHVAKMSFSVASGRLFVAAWIEEPTPERLSELRCNMERFCENARLRVAGEADSLSHDQLRRIVAILDEPCATPIPQGESEP